MPAPTQAAAATYTLALGHDMLLAVVPDGADIAAEVRERERASGGWFGDYEVVSGLTLTDELPRHGRYEIVWRSDTCGSLTAGQREYEFAIRMDRPIIGRLGIHTRHPERLCLTHPNGEPSNWFTRGQTRAEIAAILAQEGLLLRDDDTVVRA